MNHGVFHIDFLTLRSSLHEIWQMNERLLQYIWQFQYFNKSELKTIAGDPLQIIHPGTSNINQGPDFSEGKINIGGTIWVGSVELHINTSDWVKHNHERDPNYNNVILHVVWNHDDLQSNRSIPLLELKERVPKILLEKYNQLLHSTAFIPCERSILQTPELIVNKWKERLVAERLERKSHDIFILLEKNNFHWEETFWIMLARNFGIRVNSEAFAEMACSIPLNLLARHKNQIHQVEALLMGQAGLLNTRFREDYPRMLKKEYRFLQKKYSLQPICIPVFFLRMRPGNFPTVRIAQLAKLIHNSLHLFSMIKENQSLSAIRKLLNVTANDYWHYHYRFDEKSAFGKKRLGITMTDNIIINTVVPMLFTYGVYYSDQKVKEKALDWLREVSPENNVVLAGFLQLGFKNKNAWDSQAFIQMKNEYCNKKRCLDCSIGNALLRS